MKWTQYAKIAAMVGVVLSTAVMFAQASAITLEGGSIKLRNMSYEVDFSAANGAITGIWDGKTGHLISVGNAGGNLWSATFDNDKPFDTTSTTFSHTVSGTGQTLTLSYAGDVSVTVT